MLRRTIGPSIHFETILAGGLWRVFADRSQIESTLVNLAVNARDAMPEGGKLTIETGNAELDDRCAQAHAEVKAGQYVAISVSDTGTGMPVEIAERAFDPFFTTKGAGQGTGLGLSQVFGFVKQSGGHVRIYSEVGVGTSVKVYLPRFEGSDQPINSPAQRETSPRAKPGEMILLVEDEPTVLETTADLLHQLGYEALSTTSGPEALRVIEKRPDVALLLTDIVMPGMNGRETAERAQAVRPALEVLFTTGYTRNAVVHNGVVDPGRAFISKPFTLDQLARKLREVLDGSIGFADLP